MELYEAIFYRRTIKNYSNKNINAPLMEEVKELCNDITYLNEDLRIKANVIERGHLIHFLMGKECNIKAPHYIVVTSNKGEDYLQNIGFAMEKIVLQLTTLGLGTSWLKCNIKKEDIIDLERVENYEMDYGSSIDKIKEEEQEQEELKEEDDEEPCAIIAFGYAEKEEILFKSTESKHDRKSIKKISKKMDRKWIKVLNAVRISPSIKNIQPWMFYNTKTAINLYEDRPKKAIEDMSKISMGIALRHFDMACEKYDIRVEYKKMNVKKKLGKEYYISILEKETNYS
ncbi:MAG: nitroreductase family protein [Romboutsia sp.]|uniref:nitroreductase family protein n=1 Tax=Romboutsia sp. TaxID=1965302 RepID=UPI003F2B0EA8